MRRGGPLPRLVMLLALAASPAAAQTIEVRAGDHPDYARLVLDFPGPPPPWRLRRDAAGYVLSLDQPGLRFDTAGVFRMVPRDRIASVEQPGDQTGLVIGLACACHADAFEFRGRSLVIDILDGPAPEGSPFEDPAEPGADEKRGVADAASIPEPDPRPGTSALPEARVIAPDPPDPSDVTEPTPTISPSSATAAPIVGAEDPATMPPQGDVVTAAITEALAPLSIEGSRRDDRVVEAIARQLARASAQGLVDAPPASRASTPGDAGPTLQTDVMSAPAEGETPEPQDATPPDRANLRVLTGVDRDFADLGLDRLLPRSDPNCLPDRAVDIAAWGDEALVGAEIGPYRSRIIDAGDRPDAGAIEDLAQHYLFLTFGAEAGALLDAFPGIVPESAVLGALAEIMDARPLSQGHPLSGQSECPSPVALWAFLAAEDPAAETPATAAILTTFSGLPLHLRRHLAAPLATAFAEAGDTDAAQAALAAVLRAPGPEGDAVALAAATIAPPGAGGSDDRRLEDLLDADPSQAAKAALVRLDSLIAQGEAIPEAAITDVAAFAFEFRDLPLGDLLRVAEVRGLTAAGRIREALTAFRALPEDIFSRTDPDRRLSTELLGAAAEVGSDLDLIAAADLLGPTLPSGPEARGARIRAAARLIDLGFASSAAGIMRAGDADDPAVRMARARYALSIGDPGTALAALDGIETPEALPIEAEALSVAGRHIEAADAFGRLGDNVRSAAEALRARDWARLAAPEATAPGTLDTRPDANPASLLDETEALRGAIDALLGNVDP